MTTLTTHFSVTWDSYKNCISNGFSRLQQNGEFVDMTLAAEGHLVKVHQNIVALASPYLKAMIQSASCPHPVVFLNNISHDILAYILEYIYTGEVNISKEEIATFIDACKSLSISGVENFVVPKKNDRRVVSEEPRPQQECQPESQQNVVLPQINSLPEPQFEPLSDTLPKQDMLPDSQVEILSDLPREIMPDSSAAELPVSPVEILTDLPEEELPDSKLENWLDFHLEALPESQQEALPEVKQMVSKGIPKPQLNILPAPHSKAVPEPLPDELFESIILRPKELSKPQPETQPHELLEPLNEIERVKDPSENNFAAHITISDNNYNLEIKPVEKNRTQNKTCPIVTVDNFVVKYGNSFCEVDDNATANLQAQPLPVISLNSDIKNLEPSHTLVNEERDILSNTDDLGVSNFGQIKQDMFFNIGLETSKPVTQPVRKKELLSKEERDKTVHYTISTRGSLQLMLNGHIYCCHHHSCDGRKRRWRCADYRKLQCPAIIDTDHDEIVNRSDLHNHPSHDSKILKKFKSKLIFTSIKPAEEKCNSLKESLTENEYYKPKTKRRKFIE